MDFSSFLKRIESERKYVNQRFCFVLGAGASYNCGIAKASDLIDEWYGELLEDYCSLDQWKKILSKGRDEALNDTINALKNDEDLLRQIFSPTIWETNTKLTVADLIRIKFIENESEKYSRLFSVAYPTVRMRQACIKTFIQAGTPGKGHESLSRLLCETNNNIVITTNFDRLVETAIQTSGHSKDLIVLSNCNDMGCSAFDENSNCLNSIFQQRQNNAPLVIKAHGDVDRIEQKNTIEELRRLPDSFYLRLKSIFTLYKPIFIGYSGNDSGLVDLLLRYAKEQRMNQDEYGCYWLVYGDDVSHPEDKLPERARTYLRQVNGQCITHKGFESSMCEIADVLLSETGESVKPSQNIKEIPKDEISITERNEKTYFPLETPSFRDEMMLRNASSRRDI